MIRVRVPATTANLGPGFDCLGMAVSIYNHIEIERIDGDRLEIETTGPASTADIASDESNLVYQAAAHVLELAGKPTRGLRLRITLDAPLARGLGSSASAIAGGMFAANELIGKPLTIDDLARETTKMEGHPDNVVPCLTGGLSSSLLIDEQVLVHRLEPASNIRCVFFVPDYELDTATARRAIPAQISLKDAVFNASRVPFVLAQLANGELDNLGNIMGDRMHQPYRIPLIKGYELLENAALNAGAAAVCISGAGPTILAVCDTSTADRVAEAGAVVFQELEIGVQVRNVAPDTKGCQLEG